MPRAVGLMNPENAQKSLGPFKEGFVRIDHNAFTVHQGKPGEGEAPVPATKWIWSVSRLQEDGETPITDEHDVPVTEELLFSFGAKSLPFVHPGKGSGPDDDDPDDLGTAVGTSGNTIFMVSDGKDWKPNEKSGLIVLTASLLKLNIKPELVNRCWAPEWNGAVFEMKPHLGEKGADGRAFNYKVATKVLVVPGKKTKAAGASVNGRPVDAESILVPIMMELAGELDGKEMTPKALANRVRVALESRKVETALLLPVLNLSKDAKWLAKNADNFGYTIDAESGSLYFGSALPAV